MKILYLPFSSDESLLDLYPKALRWQADYRVRGKDVLIVIHGSAIRNHELIKEELRKGDCQIYVLSHGIDTPDLIVANQEVEDEYSRKLTIAEVADRFKRDLLFSGFSDKNIVKLFFCDEYRKDNKPQQMAVQFRKELGESYKSLEIKYYTDVIVSIPGVDKDSQKSFKKAMRHLGLIHDLFSLKLSCVVGNAKSFRSGLNESSRASHGFFGEDRMEIDYPEFSHPILRQLVDYLVELVSNDKVLSRDREVIINELLRLLPRDIKTYLADSITLTSSKITLEMRINRPAFEAFLIKSAKKAEAKSQIESPEISPSFTQIDDSVSFMPLDDYDEIAVMSDNSDVVATKTAIK